MRAATDADFNTPGRYLSVKIDLYLDGPSSPPLAAEKDTYLIDADWLEESGAEAENPFGAASSNELSFRLYNNNGMFNPTNISGPYYGKIKAGVKVVLYIKPVYDTEEVDWVKLGEYYVTGWTAAITSTYADVVANDIWHSIFSSKTPNYAVERDIVAYEALANIYTAMGFSVIIDTAINRSLKFSFIEGTPLSFTQDLMAGFIAFCSSNKSGQPIIESFIKERTTRLTLTDSNQIKDVTASQSISKTYEGVELTYNIPQGLDQEQLVDLQGITAPSGVFSIQNIAFSNGPLWRLTSIGLVSLEDVKLLDCTSTPWIVSVTLSNAGEATIFNLSMYGQVVGFTSLILTDNTTKLLKVQSKYLQEENQAIQYKNIIAGFVTNPVPTLTLSIRGNPLLNIGDKVAVQSTKYNLEYNGLIQRLHYHYTGSLSCDMVLLNADLLQGVT